MKILITGSSGQIGTNLGLRLLDEGHAVDGIDIRRNTWTDDISTTVRDLTQPFLGHVHNGANVVVHLAAHAKVHELVEHPHKALQNIQMTFNVLEYCRKYGLPIVYASSREVYGDVHRFLTEESQADFAYTESPYSASKLSGEALVYSYARCYGLRYVVFRFSNVYGRYDVDLDRMERVIPLFIHKIRNNQPIIVYGAKKTLDFTYVDDTVSGIMAAVKLLASGAAVNETVNLAYGQGTTLAKVAYMIGECVGRMPRMTIEDSRPGEVTHYVANIGKARALLGYAPEVSVADGLSRAVEWATAYWGANGRNGTVADEGRGNPVFTGVGR